MCSSPLAQSWGKHETPKPSYAVGRHLELDPCRDRPSAPLSAHRACGALAVTHSHCGWLLPISRVLPFHDLGQFGDFISWCQDRADCRLRFGGLLLVYLGGLFSEN